MSGFTFSNSPSYVVDPNNTNKLALKEVDAAFAEIAERGVLFVLNDNGVQRLIFKRETGQQIDISNPSGLGELTDNHILVGNSTNTPTEKPIWEFRNDLGLPDDLSLMTSLKLSNQTSLESHEIGQGILQCLVDANGVQQLYFIREDGSNLLIGDPLIDENKFLVGDANGNSSQKTADEVRTILNLQILDENDHIEEIHLNPNVTLAGRTFNTAGKLVQLDTDGGNGPRLPILDGSQLVDIDITKVKDASDTTLPTLLNLKADKSTFDLIDDNGVEKIERIEMRYGEYHDGLESGGFACFQPFVDKVNIWGVRNPSGTALCIQVWNGQFYSYGFNTLSDKRIKKEIKDISIETVDKLSKIKPKTFIYDGISEDKHIGYIAQELEDAGLDFVVTDVLEEQDFKKEDEAQKHFDNAKKQGFDPKIKKSGNGYLVTYTKKGVKYNEIAVLQQALINDLHSVLRTQGLSFLIDDIKEVYNNEYDNTYEVLTLQGDIIKSIEKNGNTQEQRIDVWVANGGKVKPKSYNNDEARTIIKEKAEELIIEKYSRDEQRNIDRECLHLKAVEGIDPKRLSEEEKQKLQIHKDMGTYIESILQKCEKLKSDCEKLRNGKLQTLVKSVMDGSAYEVVN